jgi:hypothetical protein
MKIKGPTSLLSLKGRIRFTSMPGAMDALRASMMSCGIRMTDMQVEENSAAGNKKIP